MRVSHAASTDKVTKYAVFTQKKAVCGSYQEQKRGFRVDVYYLPFVIGRLCVLLQSYKEQTIKQRSKDKKQQRDIDGS